MAIKALLTAAILSIALFSSSHAVQIGGSGPLNPFSVPGSIEVSQIVVSSTIEALSDIKLGGAGTAAGTIRWTGSNFEGFDGNGWKSLDSQSISEGWTENIPENKVYVTDTGRNIGIGTTEPEARLDIAGNIIARDSITVEGDVKAGRLISGYGAKIGNPDSALESFFELVEFNPGDNVPVLRSRWFFEEDDEPGYGFFTTERGLLLIDNLDDLNSALVVMPAYDAEELMTTYIFADLLDGESLFSFGGNIVAEGYKSSANNDGITQTIVFTDKNDVQHTLVFESGLLVNYSTSP